MNTLYHLYNELKRRNVIKAGISYLVVSWVILQVVSLVGDILKAPEWLGQTLLIVLIVFLPIWLVISWYYEFTDEGIQKTKNVSTDNSIAKKTGQKLNLIIIGFLSLAVILLFVDRYRIKSTQAETINSISTISPEKNSIVVLPFKDLSPNKDQEYFADGLADELLSSLTKISQLKVTSRTSAFSFKNQAMDIPTIADKLGVNYILEGSIRKAGNLVRITIQLIDTKLDKSLWSQNWDHELDNIFDIQDAITKAVINTLEISLADLIIPETIKTDPKAYSLYMEAKYWLDKSYDDQNSLEKSLMLINQSITIDSIYAPSWVVKSNAYRLLSSANYLAEETGYENAKKAAEKSIVLDPKYAQGYSALANTLLEYKWDVKKATTLLKKALELDPNNATIVDNYAGIELINGNLKNSLALNEKSYSLDPINPFVVFNLGLAYYYDEQFDKALTYIGKSLELMPDQPGLHNFLAITYVQQNKPEEAKKEQALETDPAYKLHAETMIQWIMNDQEASDKALQQLLEEYKDDFQNEIAQIYAMRNDINNAFSWLDKAYENRNFMLLEMQHEPLLKTLHKDDRWEKFLRKMKLIN